MLLFLVILKGRPRNCFPVIQVALHKPLVYLIFSISISSTSLAVFMFLYSGIFVWLHNILLFPLIILSYCNAFFFFFPPNLTDFCFNREKRSGEIMFKQENWGFFVILVSLSLSLLSVFFVVEACYTWPAHRLSPSCLCRWALSFLNLEGWSLTPWSRSRCSYIVALKIHKSILFPAFRAAVVL